MKKMMLTILGVVVLGSIFAAFTVPSKTTENTLLGNFVGRINANTAAEVVVANEPNNTVNVQITQRPSNSSDKNNVAYESDLTAPNGSIIIPTNGDTYWFVPFDVAQQPARVSSGGTVEIECSCPGKEKGCEKSQSTAGTTTVTECIATEQNPCTDCCHMTVTETNKSYTGSGIIIRAEHLKLNGVEIQ